jgi:hypothetical protein
MFITETSVLDGTLCMSEAKRKVLRRVDRGAYLRSSVRGLGLIQGSNEDPEGRGACSSATDYGRATSARHLDIIGVNGVDVPYCTALASLTKVADRAQLGPSCRD